jgi:hypothetical protein
MGLKDFFKRWSQRDDADAIEREVLGVDEDYEAMKDDIAISGTVPGAMASEAAREELADD